MIKLNLKNGNVLQTYIILLYIIIVLVLITTIIVFQYYFTSKINVVKKDLFYIGQNAAKSALDISELSYSEYEINDAILTNVASNIIEKNYNGEVALESIRFIENEKKIHIKVMLKLVNFLPTKNDEFYIPLEETMKLKLMEVE